VGHVGTLDGRGCDEVGPVGLDALGQLVRVLDSAVLDGHALEVGDLENSVDALGVDARRLEQLSVQAALLGCCLFPSDLGLVVVEFLALGLVLFLVLARAFALGLERVQLLLVAVRLASGLLELVALCLERVHALGVLVDDLVDLLVLDAHCLEHLSRECQQNLPCFGMGGFPPIASAGPAPQYLAARVSIQTE